MAVRDRLDLRHSSAAEHVARRILQIQEAVEKCARAPEFSGLEDFMTHCSDSGAVISAPKFTAHIADRQKAKSTVLKQYRLAREETEARRNEGNKAGKKGKKGEKDKDDD